MSLKNIVVGVGALLAIPAIVAAAVIYNGWALAILWGWFLVPLGAPKITIPLAIGVSLIYSFFTSDLKKESFEDDDWVISVVKAIGFPLLFLAFGSIVHSFV